MDLLFLKLLFRHDHTLLCTCEVNLTITMCLFFRGPQFLPPSSSPCHLCPLLQNAVLASAARISVKVVVSTAHNSPQTSPLSRYKLERNYYYRPSPISPPPTSNFFIFFLILHVFHAVVFFGVLEP